MSQGGPFQSHGADRAVLRERAIISQDERGNDLVRVGKLDDGSYGIEVRNANGQTLFKVTDRGQRMPYQYVAWSSVAAEYGFTSSSYTEIFRCDLTSIGPRIDYDVQANNQGGGATMDFRILVTEVGATFTTVVEQTNANGQYSGSFQIPAECLLPGSGSDPQGRQISIRIQGRRTAGASTPTLRLNAPLINRPE